MAKPSSRFLCSECGHESPRWLGQCPGCGDWNTLAEERAPSGQPGGRALPKPVQPVTLADVEVANVERLGTGIAEFDRILGGGIVPGSVVLVGGSPGIGKSTLLNQALANLASAGRRSLYISAEESPAQVRLRAERIGGAALDVSVVAETSLEAVLATIESERPEVCVIDSVQTLYAEGLTSAPGSVGQVREVAGALMRLAKRHRVAMMLVGHVTKDGALAGPRVLEHLVDCVLQFEGERERTYRMLRALKNRFGSTNELGVFEMCPDGLKEVGNPSSRFLHRTGASPGSCVLCAMEGSRPLLVEVQALVARTDIVPPRRVVQGIDRNRLSIILAVLGRHSRLGLGGADVFVNLAGGIYVTEPGVDLAVAIAVVSAARNTAYGGNLPIAAFGEVGLTGELRYVAHPERRLAEAAKFGLSRVVVPVGLEQTRDSDATATIDVIPCTNLRDTLRSLDDGRAYDRGSMPVSSASRSVPQPAKPAT